MTSSEPMFSVQDGARVLAFDGEHLAESTSYRPGSTRWVEFKLYKTNGGSYVLSRIGRSIIYHSPECSLVKQYNLRKGTPEYDGIPCEQCEPDDESNTLFPEKQRYWAQVMERPQAVLEALYKWDQDGARYLTLVASRLLDQASTVDDPIRKVYQTEYLI